MQIRSIEYKRLHTFAPYENEEFIARATVGPDEDVDAAYWALRNQVNNQVESADRERELAQEARRKAQNEEQARLRRNRLARERRAKQKWLREHPGKTEADYKAWLNEPFDPFADE